MKFTNVLVTGGAGFLGSQLVRKLLPNVEHIFIIDNLLTGNRSAVPKSKRITFIEDSMTNENILAEVLPNVEHIFHLACSNLYLSAADPELDFETNLYGGFRFLQNVKSHAKNLKRMIYTSTASVYGEAPNIPTPETFYQIKMPYSASKFSMEHYCQMFYHMYELPVTILRLSNVYGPGQLPSNPYCGVTARFFEAVQQQQPIPVYGDGTQTRDFTYVEDVTDIMMASAQHPMSLGRVFNVGTGVETSVNELVNQVIRCFGYTQYPVKYLPKRVVDKVYRRALNIRKLREELHLQPTYSLAAGLQKTYEWFVNRLEQREGHADVQDVR